MTAQRRHGPAPTVDREQALDRWAAGESNAAVAAALGCALGTVTCIVHAARKRGDPRAHLRRAPNGAGRHQPPAMRPDR